MVSYPSDLDNSYKFFLVFLISQHIVTVMNIEQWSTRAA